MAHEDVPYRYRLRLVPHDRPESVDLLPASALEVQQMSGWEFVSTKVNADGDDVSVFRQPVLTHRAS